MDESGTDGSESPIQGVALIPDGGESADDGNHENSAERAKGTEPNDEGGQVEQESSDESEQDDDRSEDGEDDQEPAEAENEEGDEGDEGTYDLTLTIQAEDGEPVPGATLTAERTDMGLVEGFRDSPAQDDTDADGRASFELEEGEYSIKVEADGKETERTVAIDGEDKDVTLTVDIASEEESEEDEEDGDERAGPKQAEARIAEDETTEHGTPRGATVLYLDLEGLLLDLLGLEVDLHEVVLDVRAIPGEGKLLGSLLFGVANLLSPLSTLLNRLLNSVLDLLSYLLSPARGVASRIWSAITTLIGAVSVFTRRLTKLRNQPIGVVIALRIRLATPLTGDSR